MKIFFGWRSIGHPKFLIVSRSDLQETFSEFVEKGSVPNLILCGGLAVVKLLAKGLCEEVGLDYLMVNGSDEGRNIDTVRTTLTQFCSSVSMTGRRKENYHG